MEAKVQCALQQGSSCYRGALPHWRVGQNHREGRPPPQHVPLVCGWAEPTEE